MGVEGSSGHHRRCHWSGMVAVAVVSAQVAARLSSRGQKCSYLGWRHDRPWAVSMAVVLATGQSDPAGVPALFRLSELGCRMELSLGSYIWGCRTGLGGCRLCRRWLVPLPATQAPRTIAALASVFVINWW